MVWVVMLVVLVKVVVARAVALLLGVVETAKARRAPDFMHGNSTILVAIRQVAFMNHVIDILAFWGI